MGVRLFGVVFVAVTLAGCASVRPQAQPLSQIQNQVSDIQQRIDEQEKEIVDLKYEVKELSSKSDLSRTVTLEESALDPVSKPALLKTASGGDKIIKVAASAAQVQKALKGAGLYDGKIDGKIGSKTKSAIMEFQKQHNLKADGVIGQKTWNELKQYISE